MSSTCERQPARQPFSCVFREQQAGREVYQKKSESVPLETARFRPTIRSNESQKAERKIAVKVVVAIDSFKGSMTSMQAGDAAREGVLRVFPEAEVVVRPMADGGEGTTAALVEGRHGRLRSLPVTGPLGRPVMAQYGILPEGGTAVLEMAAAAGITLERELRPLQATTYGVGEMIADAIAQGCRDFLIGIGGSATNDGGVGMLQALGFVFRDRNGKAVGRGAGALSEIASVDASGARAELKDCRFRIACDVTNPLCGANGATFVFGPQKGVTPALRDVIEAGMQNYAAVTAGYLGRELSAVPGTGAAGGLGFALLAYLRAQLVPGIELIAQAVELEREICTADVVLTGEGRLDGQTAMGKVPAGVAGLAKRYGVPVLAFAGSVEPGAQLDVRSGIDAFFPILRRVVTLEQAMDPEQAQRNMADTVEQVFRLLAIKKERTGKGEAV